MKRREIIKAGLVLIASATAASIYRPAGAAMRVLRGGTKWLARETPPPVPVDATKRMFLTDFEVAQITAIFDRLIPSDDVGIGASQAGCVVFLDHQLGGDYGKGTTRYLAGPVVAGTAPQGNQSILTPAQVYRHGLAEIDAYCKKQFGKSFSALTTTEQDSFLEALEANKIPLTSTPANTLFTQFLSNVQEGYFSDPVYGGNKDMLGWKMIGFPGARYDYRDYAEQKGKKLDIEPVSIIGPI